MKMDDDQHYYLERAEAELMMAQQSAVPEAVKAHYLLAGLYLDRAYDDASVETAALGIEPGEHMSQRE
jgi:hypothetical protein